MSPEEFKYVWSLAGAFGVGGVVFGVIVFLVMQSLGSYAKKKGENLATKEDIKEITRLQKDAEHTYNVLLEELKNRNSLRMAAVDERLKAHQEAFELWRRLLHIGDNDPNFQPILDCQAFFDKRCLYLEPEVREAFAKAYHYESMRQQFVRSQASGEHIMEAHKVIMEFGNVLMRAIKLPPLADIDVQPIESGKV